jgi:hypothetical protein
MVARVCDSSYTGAIGRKIVVQAHSHKKHETCDRCRWLTLVILAIQEAEIRSQILSNSLRDPIPKKTHHKKGLVKWLKV